MIRTVWGLLFALVIACQPVPTNGLAMVAVAIRTGFRTAVTSAQVDHYLLELRHSQTLALIASQNSATPSAGFANVPNGTYLLTADARDAGNASLVVGGPQTSSNTATVQGARVSYSAGNALSVTLPLLDFVGGTVEVSVTAPYNAGFGAALVAGSTGEVLTRFQAANSTFRAKHLPDDSYTLWTFAHDGAGLAAPALPTGPVTVSDDGDTVSGSFAPALLGLMTTIAGDGVRAFAGEGGPAVNASLSYPWGMFIDGDDHLYIADDGNNRIRMIPKTNGTFFGQAMTAGSIYTIAGDGNLAVAGDGGPAVNASFWYPQGVELDSQGNVFISDAGYCLRMIPRVNGTYYGQAMTANFVYTIAGDCTNWAYVADGVLATTTPVAPSNVAFDAQDNLYISDQWSHRIRMIPKTSGTFFGQAMTATFIYTIAGDGNGAFAGDGGPATAASLQQVWDLLVTPQGHLIISDMENCRVRMLPQSDGTYFGVAMTAGNLYTIAGDGTAASAGDGGPATAASLNWNSNLALDPAGNLYVAEFSGNRARMITPEGNIYTVLGTGAAGFAGEGGLATAAAITHPTAVVTASDGSLIVGLDDDRIVKIR